MQLEFRDLFHRRPKLIYDLRIPEDISISTIFYLLQDKFKIGVDQLFIPINQQRPDLVYLPLNATEISIEIKATQKQRFTSLTKKDINADLLIWMDYFDYLSSDANCNLKIYFIQKTTLHKYKIKKGGYTLEPFLRKINYEYSYLNVNLCNYLKNRN